MPPSSRSFLHWAVSVPWVGDVGRFRDAFWLELSGMGALPYTLKVQRQLVGTHLNKQWYSLSCPLPLESGSCPPRASNLSTLHRELGWWLSALKAHQIT